MQGYEFRQICFCSDTYIRKSLGVRQVCRAIQWWLLDARADLLESIRPTTFRATNLAQLVERYLFVSKSTQKQTLSSWYQAECNTLFTFSSQWEQRLANFCRLRAVLDFNSTTFICSWENPWHLCWKSSFCTRFHNNIVEHQAVYLGFWQILSWSS